MVVRWSLRRDNARRVQTTTLDAKEKDKGLYKDTSYLKTYGTTAYEYCAGFICPNEYLYLRHVESWIRWSEEGC